VIIGRLRSQPRSTISSLLAEARHDTAAALASKSRGTLIAVALYRRSARRYLPAALALE
jgi:hypothetical protein